MSEYSILKVYNKEDKLKFLVRDTNAIKTVSIYKYNGENVDTHAFTYSKNDELKDWQAYYELSIEIEGGLKERVVISNDTIEEWAISAGMENISKTTKLNSGNVYEKMTKYYEGEVYESEFKNGELIDFKFKIQENKIKEYLQKIRYGK